MFWLVTSGSVLLMRPPTHPLSGVGLPPLLLGSCLARVMPCERPLGWPWASRNHCNNTVTNFLPPDADSNDHTPLGLAPSLSVTTGANS